MSNTHPPRHHAKRAGRAALAAVTALLLLAARPALALEVVVSIKPLHSLVAGVMAGVGEPTLLLDGGASPHAYSLKPSDAAALARARLVVIAGGQLETFLEKPLAQIGDATTVLALAELPGAVLLEPREGGMWEAHPGHADDDAHDHDDGHDHDIDSHLWLDPVNAKVLVAAVGQALATLDPDNAASYAENAGTMAAALAALDGEVGMLLRPLRGIPFLVFHDAYQYFEHRYGLSAAGSVTIDPERQPGARRIAELRDRLTQGNVACLFREPQFSPKLAAMLVEGTAVRLGVLDPLGAALPAGPEMYPALLRGLATSLRECLAGG